MRRISRVVVFIVALASLPLGAEPLRHERDERGSRARIVRIIKSFFGVRTNSDGLMPPLPVVPPHP